MGVRQSAVAMTARLAAVAGLAVLTASCLWTPPLPRLLVEDATFPAALAPLPEGGLLYAERLTGRVRHVAGTRWLAPDPVAEVRVSTDGQRGLLGLAVRSDEVFAAWTDPDEILVVARVAPAPARLVWEGPRTRERANGGRIAFAPDGSLVIGIGDLLEPDLVDDAEAPNGKMLRLDPDGEPTQQPETLSGGWHNPFAFTFTPDGELWVADNAPGREPERLARGNLGPEAASVVELPPRTAPSGLAFLADGRLAVCGYVSRELVAYRIGTDGIPVRDGRPLATDCALDVAVLADGRVVYADETTIQFLVRV